MADLVSPGAGVCHEMGGAVWCRMGICHETGRLRWRHGAVGCTEPGAWQRLVVIGVPRGCSWHGVAHLLFVLHCLPDAGVTSFVQSLVQSLLHVMARPISSFPLPQKALTGETEYAKFLRSEALEIYRCHHTVPTQVMAQKRWALTKCGKEFDTAANLQKQRKPLDDRRDVLAALTTRVMH